LTQRTVEALNIAGFVTVFGHHSVLLEWQDTLIRFPGTSVDYRALAIDTRQLVPKRLSTLSTSVADMGSK
jgi:hypothetical protein